MKNWNYRCGILVEYYSEYQTLITFDQACYLMMILNHITYQSYHDLFNSDHDVLIDTAMLLGFPPLVIEN